MIISRMRRIEREKEKEGETMKGDSSPVLATESNQVLQQTDALVYTAGKKRLLTCGKVMNWTVAIW
jgi:hypothetical protein